MRARRPRSINRRRRSMMRGASASIRHPGARRGRLWRHPERSLTRGSTRRGGAAFVVRCRRLCGGWFPFPSRGVGSLQLEPRLARLPTVVACCCMISSGRRSRSASAHQGNPERIFHIFFGVRRRCGGWWRGGSIERGWRVFDRPVGVVTGAAGAKLPQRVIPAASPRQRRALHRRRSADRRRDGRRHHGGRSPSASAR